MADALHSDRASWSEVFKSLEEPYNEFLKAQRENDELRMMELQALIVDRIVREAKRPLFASDATGYILVDGEVIGLDDPGCQGFWMLFGEIVVGETELPDGTQLITMFNGGGGGDAGNGFFSTFILNGDVADHKEYYFTWAEAEAGHQRWEDALM